MSGPPLTSSGARRRGRRRSVAAVVAVALALAGAVATALLAGAGHGSGRASARTAGEPARATAPPAPAVSPTGLPLGRPALALSGLGDPSADALHVPFRHPPRAGLLFDLSSGRVLWQRNALRRLRIASLTKMMTALIAVRSEPPGASVPISREAVETAGSKIGLLTAGRRVRLETLLYGLLLPSGNDAAVALAQFVSGSVERFVERMNEEAARLGLSCSRFSSPSGYYDEGNLSCAADLAVLAHDDLAEPRIARVARTASAVLPFPIKGGKVWLYNNNPLLVYGYPGATGLKTGFTEASGRCLVATAERHGVRLGVVLLDSRAPGVQARQLLDRAFRAVYRLPRVHEPPMPPGA
jgi:D-alanyl-D-alanine carboxypeptidase